MDIVRRDIIYRSRSERFKIYFSSDWHTMNEACALNRLKHDLQEDIADDPYAFCILGGDLAEFIAPETGDARWEASNVSRDVPIVALDDIGFYTTEVVLRPLIAPVSNKTLAACDGNHEYRFMKRTRRFAMMSQFWKSLNIPYVGYSGYIDLRFQRDSQWRKEPRIVPSGFISELRNQGRPIAATKFRIFFHHGRGAARTPGGKLNVLRNFTNQHPFSHIVFCGHLHSPNVYCPPGLTSNGRGEIVAANRIAMMSGAYLRTYNKGTTTYGEIAGYDPVSLGHVFVEIRPGAKKQPEIKPGGIALPTIDM